MAAWMSSVQSTSARVYQSTSPTPPQWTTNLLNYYAGLLEHPQASRTNRKDLLQQTADLL